MAQRTNDPKTRERLQQETGNRQGSAAAQDRTAAGKDRSGGGATPDRAAAAKDRTPGAADRNPGSGFGDRKPEGGDRTAAAQRPAPAPRDNALKGAGNGKAERASIDRGQASRQAAAKPAMPAARPAPKAQGGAGRAGGGGHGGARGR
jgi:hypothetical protein